LTGLTIPRALRLLAIGTTLAATAALPLTQTGAAAPPIGDTSITQYMSIATHGATSGPAAPASVVQLQYQAAGAPIEAKPVAYLIFWGVQWQVGWSDVSLSGNTYTSTQSMNYITDFFKFAPGSSWNSSTGQYCSGVSAGSTSCGSSGTHVNNAAASLGGTWVDTTSPPPPTVLPDNCVVIPCVSGNGSAVDQGNVLGQEALRAAAHFGYNPDANYMIMLPKATATLGFGYYCAYHSAIKDSSGRNVAFTNMPYVMDAPLNCGANWVNQDNAYGNGWMDGYSIVAGHEFAEAETDPLPGGPTAWRDANGQENGDKCAWGTAGAPGGTYNVGPDSHGHVFAVQSLWSNSAGGCA
jgi:serine protease